MMRKAYGAIVAMALALPAHGHVPTIHDGSSDSAATALRIEDPDLSQVIYHEVPTGVEPLWLGFDAAAGRMLFVQLGIPVLDRLVEYRPAVAVIGPGLPSIDLPFEFPEGLGGVLLSSEEVSEPRRFDEPFSGTSSWILREERVTLPVDGDYFVVAYVPAGEAGRLWVALGEEERFELDEILELPAELDAVRAFHEVSGPAGLALVCPAVGFLALSMPLLAWPRMRRTFVAARSARK